ncbi:MAG TPA: hypothetical protein VHB99_18065 [Pirellulales bacterium]|nr:hypothetical protein [Pirellulales bacterium]
MLSRNSRQPVSKIAKTMASFSACAAVLLSTEAAEACPMCKTALGSNAQHFINAWGASIVFMLSMPFLLVGSFSVYMYVLVRRARAEQADKQVSPAYAAAMREAAREASLVE